MKTKTAESDSQAALIFAEEPSGLVLHPTILSAEGSTMFTHFSRQLIVANNVFRNDEGPLQLVARIRLGFTRRA
jgi:hypothetical protein